MKGRIAYGGYGSFALRFEEPYVILNVFLSQDVGRSVESCDSYIDAASEIAASRQPPLEIRGNGNIVRIMPTWVLIGNHLNEAIEPRIISMDAFVSVLRYWKSIVASWDKHNPPVDPPEFSYDDPTPVEKLAPDEAEREFKVTLANWKGCPIVHHRGSKL